MSLFPTMCGAGCALGVVGLIMGSGEKRSSSPRTSSQPSRQWFVHGAAALLAVIVGFVTGWPVAALMAGAGAVALPHLMRQTASSQATAHIEAVAVWTELLRDSLSASSGLAEALISTAQVAPAAIATPVTSLAERLTSGTHMNEALHQFARELDDPSADVVVAALLLAATARAQRLSELLTSLAISIREEVSMRLRIEASRASARSGVRSVIVFSLLFVVLLVAIGRSYLAPFDSSVGQLVLFVVGLLYAAGIYLMVHLVRPSRPARLLQAESIK